VGFHAAAGFAVTHPDIGPVVFGVCTDEKHCDLQKCQFRHHCM
jgi:hypothetical protein